MTQEQFNEQMNTRADKWSHLDKRAVKAGIAFAARMCVTYHELAKVWYDSLPKAAMENEKA